MGMLIETSRRYRSRKACAALGLAASWLLAVSVAPIVRARSAEDGVGSATTQTDDDTDTEYFINMRTLSGDEKTNYAQMQKAIESRMQSSDAEVLASAAAEFVVRIDALPACVQDDTREALYGTLSEQLQKSSDDVLKTAVSILLASTKQHDQLVATGALESSSDAWWISDPATMHTLLALLASDKTPSLVRQTLLVTFFVSGVFDSVRALAWSLARDERDPELAREAASCACGAMSDADFRVKEVEGAFLTSTGVLKQEAALALFRFEKPALPTAIKGEVIRDVVSMATDKDLSPLVRGEAIVELGRCADEPVVFDALSSLLLPENWFFGVRGHHHAEHSLTVVVPAIAQAHAALVPSKLVEVKAHLKELDSSARQEVEWCVDYALTPRAR